MTHRFRWPLAALAAALAAAPPLPAQWPTTPRPAAPAARDTLPLTLQEALARATGRSEEIRLARAQLDLAEAQVKAARSAALPQLDATAAYTRTFASPFQSGGFTLPDSLRFSPDSTAPLEERVSYLERNAPLAGLGGLGSLFGNLPFGQANAYTLALTGSQPLYQGGRVGAALRIADEFRESARLGLTEETAGIELRTRNAYLQALLALELERIATSSAEQAEAFLEQERLRLRAGTASDLDVLRAEVSLENLRPPLVEARNAASLATLDVKRLVDIPLEQPVRLTTPLAMPGAAELAAPTLEPERLLARRAAIRAAERQVAIRQQEVRIARGGYLPSVDLRFSYGGQLYPNTPFGLAGTELRRDATATVAMRVPIFSGFRTQAEVQAAQVNLESERLRLAQLRENVRLEYEQTLGERQRAAADLAARQRNVEQAQRVHDLTVLRYERGLATQLEVTDARLALLVARTNLAQAIRDFYLADARLARSLGITTTATGAPRAP